MPYTTLTWYDFLTEATEFWKISERLGDSWILYSQNDEEPNTFLKYKQKLPYSRTSADGAIATIENCHDVIEADAEQAEASIASTDLLQLEYHIVYSISYQVPVIYFQAHKSDGNILGLEEAWRIFRTYNLDDATFTRADMLSILTQMEHPVLYKPFLALHPCRTAELLEQVGQSRNRILTFISLLGPYVQLNLPNEYGLELKV